MDNFMEILKRYCNDTDKETVHSYGEVYMELLEPLEKLENVRILKIGVGSCGGFIQVLKEVLPKCTIYGIDMDINKIKYHPKDVKYYQLDGTLKQTADTINDYFDLIIDDGTHLPEHQFKSFIVFAPYLKKQGTYVIESINIGWGEFVQDELRKISRENNLHFKWVDRRNIKNQYDDIMAICKKTIKFML